MKTKNSSECLFEKYLNQHYLEFDYEPAIGKKRPDYLVYVFSKAVFEEHQLGGVIFEIKEFDSSVDFVKGINTLNLDEGWFFRCKPIREKITAAELQLREYKERFPCVVVLYHPKRNPTVANVLASMFGNIQMDILETFFYDTFTSKIRPLQCRTISAVAVLDIDENKEVRLQVIHNPFAYHGVSWAFGSTDIQIFPTLDDPQIGDEDWLS